jgi:hypothetical protein
VTAPAKARSRWACAAFACLMCLQALAAGSPSEYQVKAVFLFNFSHFVDWPSQAFKSPSEPFIIGVLGTDPFGPLLDETVRGEHVEGHPLVVRRFDTPQDAGDCRILFIDRSQAAAIDQIVKTLAHRNVLTVAEIPGSAERGLVVEFATENNRIRLKIDVDAARAAGLAISSKLLRLADIVSPAPGSLAP